MSEDLTWAGQSSGPSSWCLYNCSGDNLSVRSGTILSSDADKSHLESGS